MNDFNFDDVLQGSAEERRYRSIYGSLPRAEYAAWIATLNDKELAKVRQMEAKTAFIEASSQPQNATENGLATLDRKTKQEPHARKVEIGHDGQGNLSIDIIEAQTPLDDLLTKEDMADLGLLDQADQYDERVKGLSAFFAYCFRDRPKTGCNLRDVIIRFLVVVKKIREELLNGMSLDEIGKLLGTTKQNLSLENRYLRQMFGLKGRNDKRDPSIYKNNSKEWLAEKKAKARKERKAARDAAYYAARKEVILARKRAQYTGRKKHPV